MPELEPVFWALSLPGHLRDEIGLMNCGGG